jgi:hypothetical protein
MGEIILFGVRCQITWRPFLFPIGSLSLDELVIPIGPVPFEGRREIKKILTVLFLIFLRSII